MDTHCIFEARCKSSDVSLDAGGQVSVSTGWGGGGGEGEKAEGKTYTPIHAKLHY